MSRVEAPDFSNPRDLPILSPDRLKSLEPEARMKYFASWGVLAPSTHNTVPYKIHLGKDYLTLHLDPSKVLPASDRDGRQATVSMGCALENIHQAAQAYGLDTAMELAPTVTIALNGNPSEPDQSVLTALKLRQVNRAQYDERVHLPPTTQTQMREIAAQFPQLKLHLITDTFGNYGKVAFGTFQRRADRAAIELPEFRAELAQWLKPNEVQMSRGMKLGEFGLHDEAARNFYAALSGEREFLPVELDKFAEAGYDAMRTASAVAVLTAEVDTPTARLEAGMSYERTALQLQKEGFSTAVHAALTETGIPLIKIASRTLMASVLRTTRTPLMVFRVGVPMEENNRKRPYSVRPAVEDLLMP